MAIALSLDAFSVSLVLGLIENSAKKHLFFASLVGIFHFIMPTIGAITNVIVFNSFIINGKKLLGITLFVLVLSLLFDLKKEKNSITNSNILVLAASVSIDSYFAGLGLKSLETFSLLYFLVFSAFSCIISLAGCRLGQIGKDRLGKIANYLAIILLLLLSVKYIVFN